MIYIWEIQQKVLYLISWISNELRIFRIDTYIQKHKIENSTKFLNLISGIFNELSIFMIDIRVFFQKFKLKRQNLKLTYTNKQMASDRKCSFNQGKCRWRFCTVLFMISWIQGCKMKRQNLKSTCTNKKMVAILNAVPYI